MIILYAGRRPSNVDGPFPPSACEPIAARLRLLIAGLAPNHVYGSAAAGADLLVLQAAVEAGRPVTVYTAGTPGDFKAGSVADKGEGWTSMFDSYTESKHVKLVEGAATTDDDGFRAVSRRMLADAEAALTPGEELVVIAVTEGRREGQDHTEDLLDAARGRNHLVLCLDPGQAQQGRTAFVAMPYGIRKLGRGRAAWQSDPTFHKILAPAAIAAGYYPERTDLQASGEMIDRRMIRDVATAELFIADLSTHNPNVLWELGVRHAWADTGTVLVRADRREPVPFDIARVPVRTYRRDRGEVSDADAVHSIRELLPVLASSFGVDSPVFAALPALARPVMPDSIADEPARDRHAEELNQELDLAIALGSEDRVLAVARTDQAPTSLRVEAGFALIALGRPHDAVEVLSQAAEADTGFENEVIQQQYAHALTRTREPDNVRNAELRLARLNSLQPGSTETAGLLGSAAKTAWEQSLDAGGDGLGHLDRAVDAYRDGLRTDPGDYYTGINTVAMLLVRAWARTAGAEEDLAEARSLIPVVAFALSRPQVADDAWSIATHGELALYDHLLHGSSSVEDASRYYASAVAAAGPRAGDTTAMRRQLELLLRAGAPEDPCRTILAALPQRTTQT